MKRDFATPTLLLVALTLGSGATATLAAQVPTQLPPPSQAQAALQSAISANPALAGMIQSRPSGSGMGPGPGRARLQASGYPANLPGSYMGSPPVGAGGPAPTADHLAAITALGLPPIQVDMGQLPVDTG